jgi:hypothetical protein
MTWSSELANFSPEARCRVTAKIRRAIREERWWQGEVKAAEAVAKADGYFSGRNVGDRAVFVLGFIVGIMVGGGLMFGWQAVGLVLLGK